MIAKSGNLEHYPFFMQQVTDFFSGLFSTRLWPARWHCGQWSDFHGWLYILSDLSIWVAYFLIPIIILNYFTRKKTALKYNKVYLLFAAFILLCGTTHFLDAMMFWVPMYRLSALVRAATAVVSLATVYHLVKILPVAFQQKTSVELEIEIQKRKETELKLEQANADLQAFAYIASHDLQEPLRKVRVFASMLEKGTIATEPDNLELVHKISKASERMQTLIGNILTFSTVPEKIEPVPVDLRRCIDKAMDDLEIKIKDKNAVIDIGKMPVISGNETAICQLFMNLLGNALKFCERRPDIKISGEQQGSGVIIRVADNGIGMQNDDLSRIFLAFQRLAGTGKYEGSGIGLSICKKIMDAHQGEISVKSVPGEGTEFSLFFPEAKF
jgi:two-component system, chemotaxis family, sensor kinase Cph1